MGPRVFILNLDADLELGTRGPYTPSERVRRAAVGPRAVIAKTLVLEGDFVADEATPDDAFAGWPARAFCPTPNARAEARRLGASLGDVPSVEVLRRVARRDFAYVEELPGSFATRDVAYVERTLESSPPIGSGWRLKRAYGMASRGHRVVRGAITETDRAFVRASTDGLIVEPNVAIERELGLHGWLARDGSFVRGGVTEQFMDRSGAWQKTQRLAAGAVEQATERALSRSLERAAHALSDAGYHGPFGIDAYSHAGGTRLRECSEIHARYSMGWGFGFAGLVRPDS